MARRYDGPVTHLDLERPRDLARLEDAELALSTLRGLVVIDDVQRRPELFPVLRVLADPTLNLSWSPIPRIDVVSEVLWGRRINKDGQLGEARQIQLGTNFRF